MENFSELALYLLNDLPYLQREYLRRSKQKKNPPGWPENAEERLVLLSQQHQGERITVRLIRCIQEAFLEDLFSDSVFAVRKYHGEPDTFNRESLAGESTGPLDIGITEKQKELRKKFLEELNSL